MSRAFSIAHSIRCGTTVLTAAISASHVTLNSPSLRGNGMDDNITALVISNGSGCARLAVSALYIWTRSVSYTHSTPSPPQQPKQRSSAHSLTSTATPAGCPTAACRSTWATPNAGPTPTHCSPIPTRKASPQTSTRRTSLGGLVQRAALDYVPSFQTGDPSNAGPNTRRASRTLEYAYNDFGIGLVAKGLNKTADAAHYFSKSGDWFNLTRLAESSTRRRLGNTRGMFRKTRPAWPRLLTYSARLDTFFADGFHDIGDEPGFLPTYLYNYVGQPAKTVDRVDAILNQYFNTSLNGPGHGFYPVAGQATYLLNRPYFPKITILNGATGKTATIIANGLSATNIYIQSATLNGDRTPKTGSRPACLRAARRLSLSWG
uniref:Glycosyl hydrolase family 92 domain-containing protein n=1 Tax=Mycena chlorophos TaxID=658473 RepID=A0ABQ0LFX5_MYCCL|nr:predicted protein [Mycena chlorophos]